MPVSPWDLPTLDRLHAWLRAERLASLLGAAAFVVPAGLVALVLAVAAVVFTPVLVHGLWRLRRTGWLAAFAVLVGGALAGTAFLPGEWGMLRGALLLLAFYVYSWALSLAVAEWRRETMDTVRFRQHEAMRSADIKVPLQA